MREPNVCFPLQNRAAVCITSGLYDRRALDCTATVPLINSLTNLAYLTSTTPRIREIVCVDGGLERLVRILNQDSNSTERLTIWKRTLAFQNIVNIGIRGTEQIRTKVVNTDVIPFALKVLKTYELVNGKIDLKKDLTPSSSKRLLDSLISTNKIDSTRNHQHISSSTTSSSPSSSPLRRSTFPYVKINRAQRRMNRQRNGLSQVKIQEIDQGIFHREEDVLLCLQLLAYLSKYPHTRELFHTAYQNNVFTIVEKFCHRLYPAPIQYWAGVIMRNSCRKDESKGGIRRCANMSCGKWETQPREFAKCRRCRKAKYCSKDCQSKAWASGHRWWCIERYPSIRDATSSVNRNNNIDLHSLSSRQSNDNNNSTGTAITMNEQPNNQDTMPVATHFN